jgi:hypothetical protein
MSNDLKINDLAAQLAALSGDDALNLLDAIAAVNAKAEAARKEKAKAEAEAERNRVTCVCGNPVTLVRTVSYTQYDVSHGLHRRYSGELVGGYVADGDTSEYDETSPVGHADIDTLVKGTVFYSCGDGDCGEWVRADRKSLVGRK